MASSDATRTAQPSLSSQSPNFRLSRAWASSPEHGPSTQSTASLSARPQAPSSCLLLASAEGQQQSNMAVGQQEAPSPASGSGNAAPTVQNEPATEDPQSWLTRERTQLQLASVFPLESSSSRSSSSPPRLRSPQPCIREPPSPTSTPPPSDATFESRNPDAPAQVRTGLQLPLAQQAASAAPPPPTQTQVLFDLELPEHARPLLLRPKPLRWHRDRAL